MGAGRKRLKWYLGIPLVGFALAWGGLHGWYLYQRSKTEIAPTAAFDEAVDRFLADQRTLAQLPFFRREPAIPGSEVPREAREQARSLPEEIREKVMTLGLDAPTAGTMKEWLGKVSFDWMESLAKYQRWGDDGDGVPWVAWGRLRWAKGFAEGKPTSSLGPVRELARLAATTDRLVGNLVMVSLLKSERLVWESIPQTARNAATVAPWDPVVVEKAKRALWTLSDFFDFRMPPKSIAAVFGDRGNRVGICGAIEARLEEQYWHRPFLWKAYPESFRILGDILEATAKECAGGKFLTFWNEPPDVEAFLSNGPVQTLGKVGERSQPQPMKEVGKQWAWVSRLPYVRVLFGLWMARNFARPSRLDEFYEPPLKG
ncbi:MAG: hypothetical protein FJ112_02045 [Deltaproteobacteria bacterium]|nr:hypothetical protein [Deltaproteobacteria bacterium]